MSTKRHILNQRKQERHKKRRAIAQAAWKSGYRFLQIKNHQAFVTMMRTLAKLKAMRKEQKNDPL